MTKCPKRSCDEAFGGHRLASGTAPLTGACGILQFLFCFSCNWSAFITELLIDHLIKKKWRNILSKSFLNSFSNPTLQRGVWFFLLGFFVCPFKLTHIDKNTIFLHKWYHTPCSAGWFFTKQYITGIFLSQGIIVVLNIQSMTCIKHILMRPWYWSCCHLFAPINDVTINSIM